MLPLTVAALPFTLRRERSPRHVPVPRLTQGGGHGRQHGGSASLDAASCELLGALRALLLAHGRALAPYLRLYGHGWVLYALGPGLRHPRSSPVRAAVLGVLQLHLRQAALPSSASHTSRDWELAQ